MLVTTEMFLRNTQCSECNFDEFSFFDSSLWGPEAKLNATRRAHRLRIVERPLV